MFDINNISYKNGKTWKLLKSGFSSGVFQLETDLGKAWSRKVAPSNITEISILLALLRPACLKTGMTEHYASIKNNEEPILSFGDSDVDSILNYTYGVLVFQEQLMQFGKGIAWKDLDHLEKLVIVDKLRKGIGKKDSKLLQELKDDFISGCLKNGKSEELAEKLFGIIEKAGRYAFNASHSTKYAQISYQTAYLKANYPYEFYSVYMSYSKYRQRSREELRELINEARVLGLDIRPPSILAKNKEFKIEKDKDGKAEAIRYGLLHIKHVGKNDLEVIQSNHIDTWQKLFIIRYDKELEKRLTKNGVISLIESGACDLYGEQRRILFDVFSCLETLSGKETDFIVERLKESNGDIKSIRKILEECSDKVSVKRRKSIVSSEATALDLDTEDTVEYRADAEDRLLGLPLTCSAVENKSKNAEMTCKDCWDYMYNNRGINGTLAAVLDGVKPLITKKGKNAGQQMAILSVHDSSGAIKIACFSEKYIKIRDNLFEKTGYEFQIEGTNKGWCVKDIRQI